MSGALARGRANNNDPGVSVRYAPCAKSDRFEEEEGGEENGAEGESRHSSNNSGHSRSGSRGRGPPEDPEISFLSRQHGYSYGSGSGSGKSHVSAVSAGKGKSASAAGGAAGLLLRSRARGARRSGVDYGKEGDDDDDDDYDDDDDIDDDEELEENRRSAGSSLDRRGGGVGSGGGGFSGSGSGGVWGGTVASIASGDLELTHCPHFFPRHDSSTAGAWGSGGSEERRAGGVADSGGVRSSSSTTNPGGGVGVGGRGGPVPYTSGTQTPTLNGPRHLPGLELYSPGAGGSERTRLIGERLSSTDKISLSSPIYANRIVEQRERSSSSRQSLLEIVGGKLDRVRHNKKRFSLAQGSLLKKPRLSETNVNVITTSRVTRRQRRKEIEEKFGKRKSLRGDHHARIETATATSSDHDGCNWTFVFDPSGRLCYWWSSVVSVAFLYNFWVIIYRFAFQEISADNIALWFTLDYTADLLYVLDIAFHFRTGYLEDGVLQTDPTKLRIHYTNTTTFYIDCLCLLPLDFLYLSIGFCSILRGFRLVKVYRFWTFLDRTERHTNYPNVVRATTLMHYLIALFHWNACLYFIVATKLERGGGVDSGGWRFPKEQPGNGMVLQYLHALHWSLITLTTIGTPPTPKTVGEYVFVIFELIFALVLFATFLGHIANIVTNVSAARKEFQGEWVGVWWRGVECRVWWS